MESEPYEQSRQAAQQPPGARTLPSFAILINIPTMAEYALNPLHTPIAVAVAFHAGFDAQGGIGRQVSSFLANSSITRFDREVYINFDEQRIIDHATVSPSGKTFSFKDREGFGRMITQRYRRWGQRSAAQELCIPDPDLTLSRRMADVMGEQDFYVVRDDPPGEGLDTVATLTEVWWKRYTGLDTGINSHLTGFMICLEPVEISYDADKHRFAAEFLDPPLKYGRKDHPGYFKTGRDQLWLQLRRINSVLNIVGNFGNRSGMNADYLDRLDNAVVEIGGHTDWTGSSSYNQRLSDDRASEITDIARQSIGDILTYPAGNGFVPDAISSRLKAKGYASSECTIPAEEDGRLCRKITVRLTSTN